MPRILIVDDEPALRQTYGRALRPHGFEVTAVGDPHLVYELLESISDRCEDVANLIEGIVLENS